MGHNILITQKERERADLLRQARDIVEAGNSRGYPLSPDEDKTVTEFVKQAQTIEHEIQLLQRDQQRASASKHNKVEGA